MEFQTLKKDNRKYWVIGIVVVLAIVATVFFVGTRAKYKNTDSVQVVTGKINYTSADLTILSVNLESTDADCITVGDKCYKTTTDVPTSGYDLSDNSYCGYSDSEGNITKDSNVTINYHENASGNMVIGIDNVNQRGTKCELYFDKYIPPAKDTILANNTVSTRSDFSATYTENTAGKIFSAEDDDGTTYYFAGESPNNRVQFAGFSWGIIRINGDGTIRLIYNGPNSLEASTFNENNDDNAYVGYMYTKGEAHGTGTDSTIKGILDSWYTNNLESNYAKYLDTNAGFCNDRTPYSGTGIGTSETDYAAYNRLVTNKSPSFRCTNSSDLFTVSGSTKGNKALTYPIGLITADEVSYAGGVSRDVQSALWFQRTNFWTMTPSDFYSGSSGVLYHHQDAGLNSHYVTMKFDVYPVVNLRPDTKFTGSGTTTDPYKVVGAS